MGLQRLHSKVQFLPFCVFFYPQMLHDLLNKDTNFWSVPISGNWCHFFKESLLDKHLYLSSFVSHSCSYFNVNCCSLCIIGQVWVNSFFFNLFLPYIKSMLSCLSHFIEWAIVPTQIYTKENKKVINHVLNIPRHVIEPNKKEIHNKKALFDLLEFLVRFSGVYAAAIKCTFIWRYF